MRHFSGIQLKRVSINTFVQFLIRIATSLPTLVGTLLIAYVAGYETLGSFTKIVAFVSVFYLIVDFGMNSVFLREYFKSTEKKLGNLLLLRLLFSFALLPIVAIIAFLLPENKISGTGFSEIEKYGIIIFSLTIITTGLNISLQSILQKKLSYYVSLIPSLVSSLLLLIVIIISSLKNNLYLLLFAYVLSGATLASLLFIIVKKKYHLEFRRKGNFTLFSKRLLILSLPLGALLIFNLMYAKADMFLLSIFKPNFDVGVYGISYRFFEFLLATPTFLSNSVYPILLSEKEDKNKYALLFRKYFLLFIFVSLSLALLSFLAAPVITLLKADFQKSVLPLQILSLSLPFFFLTSLLQWHFLLRRRMKFLVLLYGSALILNVVINILYIPRFSYFAAAISTGLCEALIFVIMLWYFRKTKLA